MRHFLALVWLAAPLAGSAAAQSAADVHLPPIEIATAFSYDVQRDGTADLPGGPGMAVGVDGNVNDHFAIGTQLTQSPRMRTVMAGARVSTGFFREGPGGPGRFFADLLVGSRQGNAAGTGAAIQLGVGADVLVVRRGLSLHWALDYLFMPGEGHDFAGARVAVGIVAGPRIR